MSVCRWPSSTISVMHRSRNFCAPEANYISAVTGIVPDVWCRRRRESRPNGRAFDCHCVDACLRMAISARNEGLRVLGAGTIIGVRSPLSWQPGGISSRSADPRKSRPHPTYRAPANHCVSPATTALRRSNHRPMGAIIPPSCACLRSGLSPGAFRSLTPPPAATDGSAASVRVPLGAGGSNVEFEVSYYGLHERGRHIVLIRAGTARGPSRHNGDAGEAEPGCGQGGETG